jgi:DNA-binding beta-propeller fold protein YncE
VGLTTALAVLRKGWVIVGSLPTSDGTAATAKAGCLIVLNSHGRPVRTFAGGVINGPWDMTALDGGSFAVLFVSNVLNGTVAANGATVNRGTVVRILLLVLDRAAPIELQRSVIASGFGEHTDPAALVIGPTGLGLSHDGGTLYVAYTLASRIAAVTDPLTRISSGGTGVTISTNGAINGPLGLAVAPNGDILTANAGDGNLVETTPGGMQVAVKTIDTSGQGPGTLFGIALTGDGSGLYFVDDGDNTLDQLH